MSNSTLVDYVKLSPNKSARSGAITKITPHHMAGILSVETCGDIFYPASRKASSNYGIGPDGRVGMYVEEKYRAWTSSSSKNDNQAVTIEVANDEVGGEWHVSDAAFAKLIDLCVDICRRNGIEKLVFTGDASGNLTQHNYFAATNCPGPYLKSRFREIADLVNARLAGEEDEMTLDQFKAMYDEMIAEKKGDNPSSWAVDSCEKAKAAGIINGDGSGNYNWQDPVTREALAKILDRGNLI